ncbi:MAG: cell division protein FtsL [Clostridium perfringens]|nr:cell division protein FtsL [Clostridium perfringens]
MIFKDYDYSSESYALDIKSNTVEVEREYNSDLSKSKKVNPNIRNKNKKKNRGLIRFLVKNNMMLMIGMVFILGFTIISRDGKVYQMQEELSLVNKSISSMKSENEALEVKLLKAISLDDIASIAKDKLNMIFPTKENIIKLES